MPVATCQILTSWSSLPEARYCPSGEKSKDITEFVCVLSQVRSLISSPEARFHSLIALSVSPEAINLPSGEIATLHTMPSLAFNVFKQRPLESSHILMVPSILPETTFLSSGVNAIALTCLLWPENERTYCIVVISQSVQSVSEPPERRYRLLWEKRTFRMGLSFLPSNAICLALVRSQTAIFPLSPA